MKILTITGVPNHLSSLIISGAKIRLEIGKHQKKFGRKKAYANKAVYCRLYFSIEKIYIHTYMHILEYMRHALKYFEERIKIYRDQVSNLRYANDDIMLIVASKKEKIDDLRGQVEREGANNKYLRIYLILYVRYFIYGAES